MPSTTYEVLGMTCEHCERAVEKELDALAGVTGAHASAERGAVTVDADAPLDRALVREAVAEAGYELTGG